MINLLFLMHIFLIQIQASNQSLDSYVIIKKDQAQIDFSKRTHVMINGVGGSLGLNPYLASVAKMNRIAENFPDDQVIIFNPLSDGVQEKSFNSLGQHKWLYNSKLLNPKVLTDTLMQFSQIASLHIFGHSAISEGFFLDQYDEGDYEIDIRFYPFDKNFEKLIGHFSTGAFATLNGCNSGELLAPHLAKLWKIPVAGSLTSTRFEMLYSDGRYYVADDKTSDKWKTKKLSEMKNYIRMKPENTTYEGHYGKYPYGLPFYKFFCPKDFVDEESCLTGIANSIKAVVSPVKYSPETAKEIVREWLCPTEYYPSKTQSKCIDFLSGPSDKFYMEYSPFRDSALECDLNHCFSSKPHCFDPKKPDTTAACMQNMKLKTKSTTFMREYLLYLQALKKYPL